MCKVETKNYTTQQYTFCSIMIRHDNGSGRATTLPMGDESKEKKKSKVFTVRNPRNEAMVVSPEQMVKNPRLFLLVACLWPLAILALFASSSPGRNDSHGAVVSPQVALNKTEKHFKLNRFEMRKILDRVDVMGYGPTHPRVAFVVVGETKQELIDSVESIFTTTDLRRIFVICAVLDDGKGEDPSLVKELKQIEKGSKYKRSYVGKSYWFVSFVAYKLICLILGPLQVYLIGMD